MYDLEVFIGDPYPDPSSKESGREARVIYKEKKIWINLTRIWQLGFEEYEMFLDEFIGAIIHEFLHYFVHINKIPQTEKQVYYITRPLQILSLGHLIGTREEEIEKDKNDYEKWVDNRLKDRKVH